MNNTTKLAIGVGISFTIVFLLVVFYYVGEENLKQEYIDEQVENLQANYIEDYREEIAEYPQYRIMSQVMAEPRVKEMYRDYLEALHYGSESDADKAFERFNSYITTRGETEYSKQYPLESLAGNIFEKLLR